MHQFIGDLITSGNPSKEQSDMLNSVWGVATGDEALGLKGASLEALQQPRPSQDKSEAEPGRQMQPGAPQRKGEASDRREGWPSK